MPFGSRDNKTAGLVPAVGASASQTVKPSEVAAAPKQPPAAKVHEGKTYYCGECGAILRYAYNPLRMIHPDSACSYRYEELNAPTLALDVLKR